jgi:hypothetical protein
MPENQPDAASLLNSSCNLSIRSKWALLGLNRQRDFNGWETLGMTCESETMRKLHPQLRRHLSAKASKGIACQGGIAHEATHARWASLLG